MSDPSWTPRVRRYRTEQRITAISTDQVDGWHPLSSAGKPSSPSPDSSLVASDPTPLDSSSPASPDDGISTSTVEFDPLASVISNSDPLGGDPLSATSGGSSAAAAAAAADVILFDSSSHASTATSSNATNELDELEEERFADWSKRKKGVLLEFTANEEIGIEVDFMETSKKVLGGEEQQEARLAELDESEETKAKEVMKLTQKEYISHIERLHTNLQRAWENEQRVKSLKIAIQCAKVLADTSVIKFYPSKFVLISEILDTFGKLVYKRIFDASVTYTSTGAPVHLQENFRPEEVTAKARETCRNWFFKIASIRELLPRLYVEAAIIKCYCFLSHGAYIEVINRLNTMIRGVGDPLVATYLRVYLARKAWEVEPATKDFLLAGFNDYIFTYETAMGNKNFRAMIDMHRLNTMQYVNLFSPALEYTLESLAFKAEPYVLDRVMVKYRESKNLLVLYHLIKAFKPDLIASHAKNIATFVKEVPDDDPTYPKYKLYVVLGKALSKIAPAEEHRLPILNEVWRVVRKMGDPEEYMMCAEAWIAYPVKHLTHREVNTLLGDVLAHVKEGNAYERLQPQLARMLRRVAKNLRDFSHLTSMTHFLPVLDLVAPGEHKESVAYATLKAFASSEANVSTRDPLIINVLFSVGKTLHDSLNTLSFSDDVRKYSEVIGQFIRKVQFGKALDKHLNFYVECRRAFANLDTVKAGLVLGVCDLAMKTLQITGGKHSKKTAAFARACIAYCFITIPTMDDHFTRLRLYLASAEVALLNQSIPQAEALLKAAITLVQDVPAFTQRNESGGREVRPTQEALVRFVRAFAATLVAVPGHPEYGPFYLQKGLLKVLQDYHWEGGALGKARSFLAMLAMFSVQGQDELPYALPGVESNDVLYAGDSAFKEELRALTNKILEVVLNELAQLKKEKTPAGKRNFAELSIELFDTIMAHGELSQENASLAANLFLAAAKKGCTKSELHGRLEGVRKKATEDEVVATLYEKISSA